MRVAVIMPTPDHDGPIGSGGGFADEFRGCGMIFFDVRGDGSKRQVLMYFGLQRRYVGKVTIHSGERFIKCAWTEGRTEPPADILDADMIGY